MKRLLPWVLAVGVAACATPVVGPIPPLTVALPPPLPAPSLTKAVRAGGLPYPASRRVDVVDDLHGVKVADPYRWLEDGRSAEVVAWADAQDALARGELAKLPEREAIAARLRELFYVEAAGIPRRYGAREVVARREATKEKWVVFTRDRQGAPERVLLDPHEWAADGSASLGGYAVSWDGKKVAYKKSLHNSDEATLYVRDIATGLDSPIDVIPGGKYGVPSWNGKGDGFYYVRLPVDPGIPVAERPGHAEIRFHALGTDPRTDPLVRAKTGDPKKLVGVECSRDGRWLFARVSHGWSKTDLYFQDLHARPGRGGERAWRPLAVGHDAQFAVTAHAGTFYVSTNLGAPRWRVYAVDPARPGLAQWKEIVPEPKDATLDELTIVGGRLALVTLKDVTSRVELRELDGRPVREVPLPGLGSASAVVGDPDDDVAYYSFTSFIHPTEIHEISIKSGASRRVHRVSAPVDPQRFEVSQEFFTSADGTRVPLFVVQPRGAPRDGKANTILYGYGGFQRSLTPSFSTSIFPWLERGGVYAVVNLRGGGEYGEAWHRAGMRLKKQNVFDDFVGAAQHLVRAGVTSPERLVIRGASNGGLLVGAAMVQRPRLFGAVLCAVPLLDMIRYHRFGSGQTWVEEYGSADDADDFRALLAYSPLHHVTSGERYPPVLILSADSDDRVDPMHARKFAAALQNESAGGPVLLRVEKNAGHGGADLVRAAVEKTADEYAFALGAIAGATRRYDRFE